MIRAEAGKKFNNNGIKSFLSPFKYPIRSTSTSDSQNNLQRPFQCQRSYMDFPRMQTDKSSTTKSNLRIRGQQFYKKQNRKQNKLIKFTMNRQKQKEGNRDIIVQQYTQKQWQNNSDILILVRQLKQKIIGLQLENKKLLQLQHSDQRKIIKQDQIIRNLEQALYITRGHISYSVGSFSKQNIKLQGDCSRTPKPEKDINFNIFSGLQSKINQLTENNKKLQQYCITLQSQVKKSLKKGQSAQKCEKQGCKTCQIISIHSLQQLIRQINTKKQHQLEQINRLLFETSTNY